MSILSLCHAYYSSTVLLLFRYKSLLSSFVIRPSFIDYYLGSHHCGYYSVQLYNLEKEEQLLKYIKKKKGQEKSSFLLLSRPKYLGKKVPLSLSEKNLLS